jgi:hypothetical protein
MKKSRQSTRNNDLPLSRQSGQSMVELLVILSAMLMLIFGTIQFALIWNAKITLNYAVFEAARAGTLNNATYDSIKEGFARGLAPLYSFDEDDTDQVGAFQDARSKILDEFDTTEQLIRIERLNPTDESFADFADETGYIPNDNLRYRSSAISHRSGSSLQDANLLHLRVTYWYPLYVPLVNSLMFSTVICEGKWKNDKVCDQSTPRIPLTSTTVLRMQTPAHNTDGFYEP